VRAIAALQGEIEIAAIGPDALDGSDDERIFREPLCHGRQRAGINHRL
jgi:hypothetical protein